MFGSRFIKFLMSILKRQINSSPNFASFFIVMTHNSSANFKLIHFLLWIKGANQVKPIECSGETSKSSCHFPNHKSVFLRILYHSSVSRKKTPLCLFSSNGIYFTQKEPTKMKIFEAFEFSDQNLLNPSC